VYADTRVVYADRWVTVYVRDYVTSNSTLTTSASPWTEERVWSVSRRTPYTYATERVEPRRFDLADETPRATATPPVRPPAPLRLAAVAPRSAPGLAPARAAERPSGLLARPRWSAPRASVPARSRRRARVWER
jgi:hypothetical protein